MFGRPRCREWTPLATQQLRLRSLIQIVGYNIRPPEGCRSQCSFYLTLHHTNMSAPFYTSERISSPHPKWKDIDSEITQRMSSNNVVIRIWCHELKEADHDKPTDTIIQTWGVYFSGLRYIGANLALNFTSDCFKSNTLVFQMHGGYFCSYKSLKLDIIPAENEMEHGSLSSDSSGRTNVSKTLESKFIQNQKVKESRSVSPNKFSKRMEKEYSKSHSPVERGFKNFSSLKASTSLNISQTRERRDDEEERKKPDPNFIYEHSPDSMDVISDANCDSVSKHASKEDLSHSKIDLSETAENYDLRNESDGVPKYRYLALNFLKSEIRPSYNAAKLQKLHLLQYSIKKRQEAVQEIKERIYKKSALADECSQDDFDTKLKFRSKSQRNLFSPEEENLDPGKCPSQSELNKNGRIKEERPVTSNGPRLTLKLNDLLSFKSKPSPFQRAEHVRLTKQLEILRFKRIILADERDSKLANIRRLKERHAKLVEENQDLGLELLQDYHSLSRSTDLLKESRASCDAVRELAARSHAALLNQRTALLKQLHRIFYIEQKDETTWTICGVCLGISGDESPRANTAASDTAAAGLAAQATCLAAALAGQPLRYHITMLPKATSVMDVKPVQTPPNIPLVHRAGDEALFRYAMFLLNKCIAQLLYGRGIPVADIRPTLANLQKLLTAPCNLADTCKLFGTSRHACEAAGRSQSLRSLAASERPRHCRPFNRFKECVDGQASSANVKRHRHSRSVGSYTDDQELPALNDSITTSIMGSEPNIYNNKLPEASEVNIHMKTHNSDSELCRFTAETTLHKYEENKVVFTLGDDDTLENLKSQTLVRVSSNNEDSCASCLDDNVKEICTEIRDFCAKDVHEEYDMYENVESEPQIDVAKHIERLMSETAEATLCESCESNKDGYSELACAKNVTDDVIQSAKAVLDTGQMEIMSEDSAIEKLKTESIEDIVRIEQNTLLDQRTQIEIEEYESITQIYSRTMCDEENVELMEENRIDNTTDCGESNTLKSRENDSDAKGHNKNGDQ